MCQAPPDQRKRKMVDLFRERQFQNAYKEVCIHVTNGHPWKTHDEGREGVIRIPSLRVI